MSSPLLLCDLPLLMYRSFFALPKSIKGADGEPINATLGTVNAVLAAVEDCQPRSVVMCDGAEAADYRVSAFAGYHSNREPMPEALAHQWDSAARMFSALGWHCRHGGDLEADDVMATLARREADRGGRALILTGDRDLLQCASGQVTVLLLRPGREPLKCGPREVEDLLGVRPAMVPDLIALRGDPSDDIPGAPGIGAKKAVDLISRHGDLESVLIAAEGERPAIAGALTEDPALLLTFKEIATVRTAKVGQLPRDRATDLVKAARTAERLGMSRLAARLRA